MAKSFLFVKAIQAIETDNHLIDDLSSLESGAVEKTQEA